MNVACAVSSMSEDYKRWFKDLTIIGHEDNVPKNLDLLILTGGGDISPERYRDGYHGTHYTDPERDEREFNILERALTVNPTTKILGVCRGLQLLNVYGGGNLIQDIDTVKKGHLRVHSLIHTVTINQFSWLGRVNSLHHQAIKRLGMLCGCTPVVLAVEPVTNIPEMVSWGRIALGVQFHPEMFDDDLGNRFFSIINNWVKQGDYLYDKVSISRMDYYEEDNLDTGEDDPDDIHIEDDQEDEDDPQL